LEGLGNGRENDMGSEKGRGMTEGTCEGTGKRT
jgi:hypothetical protein